MSKINILPSIVYNRIAAGEVVDRPYSVVKELVENAIDAGAKNIEIYIEKGGKQLIRVIDDGCGIERDDLHSAFLPHATSKITAAEDLENILTLGFRGEAVASIASVSKMTITSKTQDGKCYSLTSDGGALGEITESAGQDGTDVKVEMLFFNTPVRLGFLKTDKGEESDITHFVSRFILSRPNIAFTYYADGKKLLQSFGGSEEEALVAVYGAAIVANCYQIDATRHGIRVRGYIGNQNYSKPNKTYQSLFLNGRNIVNATVSGAISNAYNNYLMKRQYPFYVLHIDVPTEIVDVNVHPNKADVRFADNRIVYGAVYTVISAVLDGKPEALNYLINAPTPNLLQDETEEVEPAPLQPEPIERPQYMDAMLEIKRTQVEEEPTQLTQSPKIKQTAQADKPFPEVKPVKEDVQEPQILRGYPHFTYEQAKQYIEVDSPVFTAKKKGEDKEELPYGVEGSGYIRLEDIPDTIEPPKDEKPKRISKKYAAEALHKKYPNVFFKRNYIEVNDPDGDVKPIEKAEEEDVFTQNKRYLDELETKAKQNKIEVSSCRFVGKVFNTYLLYERNTDVYIIDQHAAHERLIFNRLKDGMQNRTIVQQPMLLPYQLDLNAFESEFIRERIEDIREMGFEIEEFGMNSFKISAVPVDLQKIDVASFFNEILGDVSGYRAIKLAELLKDKLAMAACKAAVKGGMDLTQSEIDKLFELMDGNMSLKCPHGRPVVVKLTKTELEKMFKRIV